jgi:hypothetical protein
VIGGSGLRVPDIAGASRRGEKRKVSVEKRKEEGQKRAH